MSVVDAKVDAPPRVELAGAVAAAYAEFQAAGIDVRDAQQAYAKAQERFRLAIGKLTELSVDELNKAK